MQALKIGSAYTSRRAFVRCALPAHPAAQESALDNEPYDEFRLDYDSTDDLEPEPALTSDDATAPSSSHPPSPSLSPIGASMYVDVMSSSPTHDSFFGHYSRRTTLEEKPGIREDIAAALLSLALPRVGVSPHVNAVSAPPVHRPEPASSTTATAEPPALSLGPTNRPPPKELSPCPCADPNSVVQSAAIDLPVEGNLSAENAGKPDSHLAEPLTLVEYITPPANRLTSCTTCSRDVSLSDNSEFDIPAIDAATCHVPSSPPRAPSPLPPSSPFPEDPDDMEEDMHIEELRLPLSRVRTAPCVSGYIMLTSISQLSSPLSRLSTEPRSSPLSVFMDLPEPSCELEENFTPAESMTKAHPSLVPDQEPTHLPTMSPLSSPPSSPHLTATHVLARKNPSKRQRSEDPSTSSLCKRKRKSALPDTDEDVENVPVRADATGAAPAPTTAQAARRRRNHTGADKRQVRSKNLKAHATDAIGDARVLPPDPALALERSDSGCPHPVLLGLIVEAFALSRATALGTTAIADAIRAAYPATHHDPPAVDAVLAWATPRGLFEAMRSSGDGLPPTFFYLPAADWDRERADTYAALGGRGTRAVKRAYKQYYWKPVVLPRAGGRARRTTTDDEVKRGWDVDWEE
jgi:hypothetical protein